MPPGIAADTAADMVADMAAGKDTEWAAGMVAAWAATLAVDTAVEQVAGIAAGIPGAALAGCFQALVLDPTGMTGLSGLTGLICGLIYCIRNIDLYSITIEDMSYLGRFSSFCQVSDSEKGMLVAVENFIASESRMSEGSMSNKVFEPPAFISSMSHTLTTSLMLRAQ
ncbi:predicted protein [Pyrenophora tritici-repentis Pt-1C-BFP]|uniref:Uncharacterized protein n=1 Tax=Pyrenophora tritici-repentis (strain Pt-1C-BFP) TaxID=426418 RepID=B2WEP7_PYRTR|nr:uncharacterized protein PTRG_08620 [Pyrenophora tritici-repentis Pt-1C-BFP]EDU51539.1 predicted protein [Pyrenophora tritici-repentis Pt-1C-BFP]